MTGNTSIRYTITQRQLEWTGNNISITPKGYEYRDKFGNRLTLNQEGAQLTSAEITQKSGRIYNKAGKIVNGEGGDNSEGVAKGDTLKGLLDDILSAIGQITVTTAVGPSSPPVNLASFEALAEKTKSIISELTFTD